MYKITWFLDASYFNNGDGTPSEKYKSLHFLDVPFVLQHPAEKPPFTNWKAKRDKSCFSSRSAMLRHIFKGEFE